MSVIRSSSGSYPLLYCIHRLRLYFCIPSSIERLYVLSQAVFERGQADLMPFLTFTLGYICSAFPQYPCAFGRKSVSLGQLSCSDAANTAMEPFSQVWPDGCSLMRVAAPCRFG